MAGPASVEEYLASLPGVARAYLEELRATILSVVPGATETISYQMPAVRSGRRIVVWYAAFKDHYSVFPATEGVREALGPEVEPYLSGKGTIRLPADEPVPVSLVERIVEARLRENASA
ncbi:MAG TPA: DUF1801 domain-containing protein [Actinomycetota bacterium]